METIEKSVEIINDLIEINNDRADGFQKALKDLEGGESDLKSLFEEYSSQSRQFSQELTALAAQHGGDTETGNSVSGTLHRAWIDVKALFTGSDRKAILAECERGEDAIKKAYREALAEGVLPAEAITLIAKQAQAIGQSHDRIKALRDSAQ
ncbi:PA2169 family four-helix-bundle protein [Mucilaginibacter aquatilis]|uniref:PA2169 family four-helix-bundle protein n=1 Tax=Mucilaginibacter aquatilis TaxID=1517760 RepID=A0A6I4IFR4_9SPHI|nr:PA2169 family four-helix-bundle protein [Mucilaginibacter aquatilis]MVN92488.1 PA2169 family four-helix-bundle protein [Mucilaginibacter aquatilis]